MRLIDADALKSVMIETLESLKRNPKMDLQEIHLICAFHTVGMMVDDSPTVDAIEVVRCKDLVRCQDCKWWFADINYDGLYRCANDGLIHKSDWFCADGIRREIQET